MRRIFHVVSNTHWDREWRFPFQKNRQMLVNMMDEALRILESDPAYRAFHLDSQSIVLDDYLAVRPDRRGAIERLVREGRLLIGPWFILPDEFQVGGESLIRNLLLGHRLCAPFGGAAKIGYSPFSWGQISQLPQIYKEFGVDVIMFYRGVNALESPKAEFVWEAPDGTRALTSRFSTMPRYNFYFYIYRPAVHNEPIAEKEFRWTRGGAPFHFADPDLAHDEDYYLLNPAEKYFADNVKRGVDEIIKAQAADFTTPHVIWCEGHDSSGPHPVTPRIIRDANAALRELGIDGEVIHSTLTDYAAGLLADADMTALPVVTGERRSAQFNRRSTNLYGYTTSARMFLKQENFDVERWLQFYAEPFNAIAGMLGLDIRDEYLNMAWRLLLENSAHDSIGGCSLDEVHADMMSRSKQAREIARGVFERAAKFICGRIDLAAHAPESIHLVAFNPTTYERDEIVEAVIDVPQELDKGGLAIKDAAAAPVPLQLIERAPAEPVLEQMTDCPMFFKMIRYRAHIALKHIPSLGFTTAHVEPAAKSWEAKGRKLAGRAKDKRVTLENEHLRVAVNANGTLDVTDKAAGHTTAGIAYFADEGEAGHAWVHTPVEPVITTLGGRAKIKIVENGPLTATVAIQHAMKIPAAINLAKKERTGKPVTMPITLHVTLKKGARRVDLGVAWDNPAESHRLRVMVPTGLAAEHHYGEGQFDVPRRAIARPDTSDWVEQPMHDYPMHHFCGCNVGISPAQTRGLSILVDGLKEYEAIPGSAGVTLAVTLFRAYTYIIQPSSVQDYSHQKGAQCLGPGRARLAFYPHAGDWAEGGVYPEALRFNLPPRLAQVGRTEGNLSPVTSFLRLASENLIFSALKEADDRAPGAFTLRVYNPTEDAISGRAEFHAPVSSVERQTMEEKAIAPEDSSEAGFTIAATHGKIVTYRVAMKS